MTLGSITTYSWYMDQLSKVKQLTFDNLLDNRCIVSMRNLGALDVHCIIRRQQGVSPKKDLEVAESSRQSSSNKEFEQK